MRIVDASRRGSLERLFAARERVDPSFERRVGTIVQAVRQKGDAALVPYARRFDGVTPPLEVPFADIEAQAAEVPADVRRALRDAARNIARVAFRQIPKHVDIQVAPGILVEQRVEPLARVGCYVPGGRYPLPSSLLMTAIPARVAGVREVVVACPRPAPVVMAAALEAGISRMFRMGGAHAIAAMAYGTESVPRVDKIVGPGNRYVSSAKAQVARDCAIDFYAGPTEIAIVAGRGRAGWIAADLVAQAEHDPDARAVFITWNRRLAAAVAARAAADARSNAIARRSLASRGLVIIAPGEAEAMAIANRLAPEHLVLEHERLTRHPIVAGSVFVGPWTVQAAGDYSIGSNHVLPTSGAARFRGGLGAADFVRVMSVQRLSAEGLRRIAPAAVSLARAEGLAAHAASIEARFKP